MATVADVVGELLRVELDPATRSLARLRLADTGFAVATGLRTEQGGRSTLVGDSLYGRDSVAGRAYRLAAACRMTEIDDIDLLSCTTPGAAVIPTVLAVAGSSRQQLDVDAVLDAIAIGYEVMVGLGEALAGPRRLATGVWPSLAVGAITSAVVTAHLLGGDGDEVQAAAVVASQQSIIGNPRGLSREHLFGGTVVAGIGSALGSRRGFRAAGGTDGGPLRQLLTEPLEAVTAPRVARPAVKQFCSARQAMTAIAAVRELVGRHGLSGDGVELIDVEVPLEYAAMLDKPAVHTRRDSISSAPYQLALAVSRPEGLLDIDRTDLGAEDLADLMARVRIRASAELSSRYPGEWPARVQITAGGATYGSEARAVPGEDDLSATTLAAKAAAFASANPRVAGPAAAIGPLVAAAHRPAHLIELLDLIEGASR